MEGRFLPILNSGKHLSSLSLFTSPLPASLSFSLFLSLGTTSSLPRSVLLWKCCASGARRQRQQSYTFIYNWPTYLVNAWSGSPDRRRKDIRSRRRRGCVPPSVPLPTFPGETRSMFLYPGSHRTATSSVWWTREWKNGSARRESAKGRWYMYIRKISTRHNISFAAKELLLLLLLLLAGWNLFCWARDLFVTTPAGTLQQRRKNSFSFYGETQNDLGWIRERKIPGESTTPDV